VCEDTATDLGTELRHYDFTQGDVLVCFVLSVIPPNVKVRAVFLPVSVICEAQRNVDAEMSPKQYVQIRVTFDVVYVACVPCQHLASYVTMATCRFIDLALINSCAMHPLGLGPGTNWNGSGSPASIRGDQYQRFLSCR
jgi:hypothetical protein